jgi:ribosomal protein L12E/L44/L45/RPP1/RPP2
MFGKFLRNTPVIGISLVIMTCHNRRLPACSVCSVEAVARPTPSTTDDGLRALFRNVGVELSPYEAVLRARASGLTAADLKRLDESSVLRVLEQAGVDSVSHRVRLVAAMHVLRHDECIDEHIHKQHSPSLQSQGALMKRVRMRKATSAVIVSQSTSAASLSCASDAIRD